MSVTLKDKLGELRRRHEATVRTRRAGWASWPWLIATGAAIWVDVIYKLPGEARAVIGMGLTVGLFVVVWGWRLPRRVRNLPEAWYAGLCDENLKLTDRPLTTAAELGGDSSSDELAAELRRRVVERADELSERVNPRKVLPWSLGWLWLTGMLTVVAVWIPTLWLVESEQMGGEVMRFVDPYGDQPPDGEVVLEERANHESRITNTESESTDDEAPITNVQDPPRRDKLISNDQTPSKDREAASGSGSAGQDGSPMDSGGSSPESTSAAVILERLNVPEDEREHIAAMVDAAPAEYREAVAEYMLRIHKDSQ